MVSLNVILNGEGESGVGNIQREGLDIAIPMLIGLAYGTHQTLTVPHLEITPFLITSLAPLGVGLLEMFRQLRIQDLKSKAMKARSEAIIQKERANIVKSLLK